MRCLMLVAALMLTGAASPAAAQPAQSPPLAWTAAAEGAPLASAPALDVPECNPPMLWFGSEYLMWFVRRESSPPLVRFSSQMLPADGNLPAGSTAVVFPTDGRRIDYDYINGARVTAGAWLNRQRTIGVEASGFALEQRTDSFRFASPGLPILARFYINANSQADTTLFFSRPDEFAGALGVRAELSQLYSGEANVRFGGYTVFADRTDYIAGFRYFDMRESIAINGRVDFPDDTRLFVNDHFRTQNQFYGLQFGLHAMYCGGSRFEATGTFKLGIGSMHQRVRITGDNRFEDVDGTVDQEALGLYARPSNIGDFARNRFAVLPELNLNLAFRVTNNLKLTVGYNILYVSSVVRPGQAIDPVVNDQDVRFIANPTTGPANRPAFGFRGVDTTLQGFNFGAALEF